MQGLAYCIVCQFEHAAHVGGLNVHKLKRRKVISKDIIEYACIIKILRDDYLNRIKQRGITFHTKVQLVISLAICVSFGQLPLRLSHAAARFSARGSLRL